MPYAANGHISQASITGGISITEQQYKNALAGMMEGKVVSIVNGSLKVEFPIAPKPAEPEPTPEPTTYQLYKSTIIRRLDDDEAVTIQAVIEQVPVKMRMLWDASEWVDSADPLFTDLTAAITGALGAARAAQILAREA